jgi:branched-chain amino acid transport system substrate-binding protein
MNMKRNMVTFMVSALILSILLTACGGTSQQSSATIKIGASLCLTGIQAPLDEPALKGAQLAVDEINKKGGVLGKKLELINLDGKSDPVTVGNNAVQLVQEGVVAIIAPSDFDFGGPASREAQKAGIVGISPAASSPLYGSKSLGDKQFTMSMWNTTMGAAAAQYASDQGWKNAYVVTDDFIQYTKDLGEYFTKAWENGGGTVVYQEKYTQGAGDFSAQLARMKALPTQPDFYYISSYMPDLGLIIRTMREAGINAPIIGGDSYDDPGLFQALGPQYGNDIIFATHTWVSPDTSPQMADFMKAYEAKFGGPPEAMWAATGWDVVNILVGAMQKAGSTDGAAMAKAMEDNSWDLLTGKLTWENAAKGHETHKQAAMVKLASGKPEFIDWLLPTSQPAP